MKKKAPVWFNDIPLPLAHDGGFSFSDKCF